MDIASSHDHQLDGKTLNRRHEPDQLTLRDETCSSKAFQRNANSSERQSFKGFCEAKHLRQSFKGFCEAKHLRQSFRRNDESTAEMTRALKKQ